MIDDGSVMAASPGQGRVHSPRAWGRASAGGDEGRCRRPAPSFRWPREQEQFSVPDKAAETKGKEEAVDACLVRAEGACRTPSPLPAGQYLFPLAGRGLSRSVPVPGSRGKRPCPKDSPRQHAVDWIRASKYRPVRLGAKRATTKNQARLGWATKKESKSQRHARCCRAPPRHAPRRSRLLPVPRSCTQERALRNMNSELGSSRRTVATVFYMGWTPPSERQL